MAWIDLLPSFSGCFCSLEVSTKRGPLAEAWQVEVLIGCFEGFVRRLVGRFRRKWIEIFCMVQTSENEKQWFC